MFDWMSDEEKKKRLKQYGDFAARGPLGIGGIGRTLLDSDNSVSQFAAQGPLGIGGIGARKLSDLMPPSSAMANDWGGDTSMSKLYRGMAAQDAAAQSEINAFLAQRVRETKGWMDYAREQDAMDKAMYEKYNMLPEEQLGYAKAMSDSDKEFQIAGKGIDQRNWREQAAWQANDSLSARYIDAAKDNNARLLGMVGNWLSYAPQWA